MLQQPNHPHNQAAYSSHAAYHNQQPSRQMPPRRTGRGGEVSPYTQHTYAASYNRAQAQQRRTRGPQNYATGTTEYSDYSRYVSQRQQRQRKSPIPIIIAVIMLAAIGVGGYLFFNPLSFDVTINGVTHTVNKGTTLENVLDKGLAAPQPGNLLAIDGSLLTEGGGSRFSATVNDEAANDPERVLHKNDVVNFTNGSDITETFHSTDEEIPFQRVEDENYWNGSLHIYIPGVNGIRTSKVGDVSGITLSEDTQPVVNEEYKIYNANTDGDMVVALTFDDGPWPDSTSQILDILEQNDAKATFFTIGEQISSYADELNRMKNAGHQICTHTWDHASGSGQGVNLTYMTAEEQIAEVQKGQEAIASVTGTDVSRVMRAPGGNFYGDLVWTLQPYISAEIGWNVDTEDWQRPGADVIAQRIMSAEPGDVILMHDGGGDRSQTVEALRQALPALRDRGYRFVTVDELLSYGTTQTA